MWVCRNYSWYPEESVESIHEGVRYPCSKCEFAATTAGVLKTHVESKHGDLKIHVESKHKRLRYSCPECEYLGTTARYLKRHVENKHEGVRYPCPECEYAAKRAGDL